MEEKIRRLEGENNKLKYDKKELEKKIMFLASKNCKMKKENEKAQKMPYSLKSFIDLKNFIIFCLKNKKKSYIYIFEFCAQINIYAYILFF